MAVQSGDLSRMEPNKALLAVSTLTTVETPLARTWRRFRRHKLAMAGLVVIIVVALMGIAAPIVAPQDPLKTSVIDSLEPPSAQHWLGTDPVGRDVWSRTVY